MSAKSKSEVNSYYSWFLAAIPQRIEALAVEVRAVPKYSGWNPDLSPSSLEMLGSWFGENVQTRERSAAELEAISSASPYPIEISGLELTDQTFAAAMSVAMYLSQVLQKQITTLSWKQQLGSKRNVDYGHAVFDVRNGVVCNPVHLSIVLAYGISRGKYDGGRLPQIYGVWSRKLAGA